MKCYIVTIDAHVSNFREDRSRQRRQFVHESGGRVEVEEDPVQANISGLCIDLPTRIQETQLVRGRFGEVKYTTCKSPLSVFESGTVEELEVNLVAEFPRYAKKVTLIPSVSPLSFILQRVRVKDFTRRRPTVTVVGADSMESNERVCKCVSRCVKKIGSLTNLHW